MSRRVNEQNFKVSLVLMRLSFSCGVREPEEEEAVSDADGGASLRVGEPAPLT